MEFPGERLVIKLWETLAEKGIGSLLAPWQTAREGRASNEVRREELLMLAQAEVDAVDIRAGRKRLERDGTLRLITSTLPDGNESIPDALGRLEPTISLQSLAEVSLRNNAAEEARREINAAKAIIYAEEVLSNDSQIPPDRSIDDDWLYTWRDYAGRVSTEDLQQLWGKILAGEVKSPGSYSIRTLEFLRGLSKEEADQISKLAGYVIEGRIVRSLKQYLEENGITLGLLLVMQELGLLSGVESIGLNSEYKSVVPERFLLPLRSNGKVLVVEHDDPTKVLKLEVYLLTGVGGQLFGLGSFPPNIDYLRLVGKEIAKKGFSVHLADWVQTTETVGNYFNKEKIDADLMGSA